MQLVIFFISVLTSLTALGSDTAKIILSNPTVRPVAIELSHGQRCVNEICGNAKKRDLSPAKSERRELKKAGLDKALEIYFKNNLLGSQKALSELVVNAETEKEKKYYSQFLEIYESRKDTLFKGAAMRCLSAASMAYRDAPSAAAIASYEKRFKSYKVNFLKTLELFISKKESLPQVKGYLSRIELKYSDKPKENYMDAFKKELLDSRGNSTLQDEAKKFFKYFYSTLASLTDIEREEVLLAAATNLGNGCPADSQDYYMPSMISPVISASGFVVGSPELGEGVAYHELAHAFVVYVENLKEEGRLSATTARDLKRIGKCLEKKHLKRKKRSSFRSMKGLARHNIKSGKGDFYLGEDIADALSARTIKTTGGINTACQFPIDSFSIENEHKEDPHASEFFRIIQSAQVIDGKLPASCKKAVKKERVNQSFFKDCLGR